MTSRIDPLLEPLTVRGLTLPNRIIMSPMTRGASPNGVPGGDVAAYYARRAAGGGGPIFTRSQIAWSCSSVTGLSSQPL